MGCLLSDGWLAGALLSGFYVVWMASQVKRPFDIMPSIFDQNIKAETASHSMSFRIEHVQLNVASSWAVPCGPKAALWTHVIC